MLPINFGSRRPTTRLPEAARGRAIFWAVFNGTEFQPSERLPMREPGSCCRSPAPISAPNCNIRVRRQVRKRYAHAGQSILSKIIALGRTKTANQKNPRTTLRSTSTDWLIKAHFRDRQKFRWDRAKTTNDQCSFRSTSDRVSFRTSLPPGRMSWFHGSAEIIA